jgi:signal transduction histidine kinase
VLRDVTEHRRLERSTQEGLDAILAMARALTGPDPQDRGADATADATAAPDTNLVARGLVAATRRLLGCERVSLMEVDPETEHLRPLVSVGWPAEIERQWHSTLRAFRVRDYLSPRVAARLRAGEVLLYDFSEAAQRGLPTYSSSKLLLAPLRLGASLVGVLILDHGPRPHVYSADEQALVRGTADLAALVLQRDRLWREREEARANELALQETTRRMEEFLATASHDLRTPLTSTVGFVDLASRQFQRLAAIVGEMHPELHRRIEGVTGCLVDASQGGKRLSRLLNLLFDTSLLQAGKLELHSTPLDLVRLVREQVEALRMSAPQRTIRFQSVPTEAVTVVADADRIGQVIMNYVANALKYSPDDRPVDVRMTVGSGSVRVAVEDHGPGLPMSERERIWQPFYRAPMVKVQSGSSVGLGLGLHICKAIIERHGGQVGLDSKVGRGSTFWFTLPLASAGGVAASSAQAQEVA